MPNLFLLSQPFTLFQSDISWFTLVYMDNTWAGLFYLYGALTMPFTIIFSQVWTVLGWWNIGLFGGIALSVIVPLFTP